MRKKRTLSFFIIVMMMSALVFTLDSCKVEQENERTYEKISAPEASLKSGNYIFLKYVTLFCATDGASIFYTTNGSTPIKNGIWYTDPILIGADTILKAVAVKDGIYSDIMTEVYNFSLQNKGAAIPQAAPPGGEYFGSQSVTLTSATEGALIYYTTDGSEPTAGSSRYTGTISISNTTANMTAPVTLKAIAVKEGMEDSYVFTAIYTITRNDMPLTEAEWLKILQRIESDTAFNGTLDLTNYVCSSSAAGGGLRSDGTFDPQSDILLGKRKIVHLILPDTTAAIVSGTSEAPAFNHFTNLTKVTFSETFTSNGFSSANSFPGDLIEKYLASDGGAGTYTRPDGTSEYWTKTTHIPITDAAVAVTAPIAGAEPNTESTGTGSFTIGNVTWLPAHDTFRHSTVYTASVTLTADSSYTFTGLTTAAINGRAAVIAVNTGSAVMLTYTFNATRDSITNVNIGVTAPVTGAMPSTASIGEGGFGAGYVTWSPSHNPFQVNTSYTASISLSAGDGAYTELTTATINGNAAEIINNNGSTVTLKYTFPATTPVPIAGVYVSVTAPAAGAAPSTALTGSGNIAYGSHVGYVSLTGTGSFASSSYVMWGLSSDRFHAGRVYTVRVVLYASNSYTFTELTTATINGNAAVITENTGNAVSLTYDFPATKFLPIYSAAINVTAPVTGVAAPDTTPTDNDRFTNGNITWSPAHDTFQNSTAYTANVTLTASGDYTFEGLFAATINGKAAGISGNIGTEVTLTYQFLIMDMVQINPGTFTMGSPTGEANRESNETQHQVKINKGFYMGKYEVTQEQFQTVMGVNPSYFNGGETNYGDFYPRETPPGEVQGRRPVETVTWYDAVEFCNKLSERESLTPAYTITNRLPETGYPITGATVTVNWNANGYRLPTEAEWEYACRAGTTTAFNTGNTISNDTGWYGDKTHEIGLKPPNAWGLHDMHGNVGEWCWDRFGTYVNNNTTQNDPKGPDTGIYRVYRGGNFLDFTGRTFRSAYRGEYMFPYETSNVFGFRVVRQ